METGRYPVSASCIGFELRKDTSKYYAYEIRVRWSSDQIAIIYRRYSQFFNLQCKLLDTFSAEAGSDNPKTRTIPFLPGKKFIANFSQKVAGKRQSKFNDYMIALLAMPEKISRCNLVVKFFESRESDLSPLIDGKRGRSQSVVKGEVISEPLLLPQYEAIADYTATQKGEMSLTKGSLVVIVDKKDTGWWFGQSTEDEKQGWVPATYLDPVNEAASEDEAIYASLPINPERFVCIENYTSCRSDEISVSIGQVVEVTKHNSDGWWLVKFGKEQGYFPAAYLRKANTLKAKELISKHDSKYSVKRPAFPVSQMVPFERKLSKYAPPRLQNKPKPPRPSTQPRPRNQTVTEPAHMYDVISDFEKTVEDGITLHAGHQVELLMKDDSGWWLVECGGVQGWAPSTYLKIVRSQPLVNPSPPSARSKPTRPPAPAKGTLTPKSSPKTTRAAKPTIQSSDVPADTPNYRDLRREGSPWSGMPKNSATKPSVPPKSTQSVKPVVPTAKPKLIPGANARTVLITHQPSSSYNNNESNVAEKNPSVSELRQRLKAQFEKNS